MSSMIPFNRHGDGGTGWKAALKATLAASTPNTSTVVRPLGSQEHLFWLLDQNRSFHFALTAQITGTAAREDWRKALDSVQKRHPLLSVCIEANPGSVPRFCDVADMPIPLRTVFGDPETLWEKEVTSELATPFAPGHAPLVRAVLIQGPRGAAFTLVGHHAISDGLSFVYVIRDLLQALNGVSLEPLCVPPSLDEALGLCGVPPEPRETTNPPQEPVQAARPATYCQPGQAAQVQGLRLSGTLTKRLRDRARLEGTSVHGVLAAAFALAAKELREDWREIPVRLLSPMEVRTVVGVGEQCGLYANSTCESFHGDMASFWDMARLEKKSITAAKTLEGARDYIRHVQQVLGDGIDVATAAQIAAHGFAHDLALSNLGALPLDRNFGNLRLESLWGPAVSIGFADTHTIGVATVDESLTLTYTSHTPLEGLLEEMRNILVEVCLTGSHEAAVARRINEGAD